MSDHAKPSVVELRQVADRTFFRVESATATETCPEYLGQTMVAVHERDLPAWSKSGAESAALFLVTAVESDRSTFAKVFVSEVDYELSDSTLVAPVRLLQEMRSGAHVLVRAANVVDGDLTLGRLNQHQQFDPYVRTPGSNRGPRGPRAERRRIQRGGT
jgi:hypothetical protein